MVYGFCDLLLGVCSIVRKCYLLIGMFLYLCPIPIHCISMPIYAHLNLPLPIRKYRNPRVLVARQIY